MKIVNPSYEILRITEDPLETIELVGRTCYKSQDKIAKGTASTFVGGIVKRDHTAMIEFADLTVRFVTQRAVSHEMVRMRLCSFAQESQRYVSYGTDKENQQITVIRPHWCDPSLIPEEVSAQYNYDPLDGGKEFLWLLACRNAEVSYRALLKRGVLPQDARDVLPNSTRTEIVVKANLREWRHIFQLRAVEKAAHPEYRRVCVPLYLQMRDKYPEVFDLGDPEGTWPPLE